MIASNARIKAEQEKDNFKAPFYPIQYLGDFLLEVSKINSTHLNCLFYKILIQWNIVKLYWFLNFETMIGNNLNDIFKAVALNLSIWEYFW